MAASSAVTHYCSHEIRFKIRQSLVECRLETGRTHQIRVHMAHIGHPLIGDPGLRPEAACRRMRNGGRANIAFKAGAARNPGNLFAPANEYRDVLQFSPCRSDIAGLINCEPVVKLSGRPPH